MANRRVLVISGAGASRNLGRDDHLMPLMPDWATSLCNALGGRAQQVRLTPNMAGDEFEATLGRFLSVQSALPLVGQYGYLGTPGEPGMGVGGDFQGWFDRATQAARDIVNVLHDNLFQSFGPGAIDPQKAQDAYATLHSALRYADPEVQVWHATTNYDLAIEVALREMRPDGWSLVNGFNQNYFLDTPYYQPDLFQTAIADGAQKDLVPVIHLHGAVGWYYEGSRIEQTPADKAYIRDRLPALLLPDDRKDPRGFTQGLSETWKQFTLALSRATHVLIVGHSLHDKHLLEALRNQPLNLAVVKFQRTEGGAEPRSTIDDDELLGRTLGQQATVIAGEFGPSMQLEIDKLRRWAGADGYVRS